MFDWVFWWAGRRWGDGCSCGCSAGRAEAPASASRGCIGSRRGSGRSRSCSPTSCRCPRPLIYAAVGDGGMRLGVFLVLDVLGTLLWTALLSAAGYGVRPRTRSTSPTRCPATGCGRRSCSSRSCSCASARADAESALARSPVPRRRRPSQCDRRRAPARLPAAAGRRAGRAGGATVEREDAGVEHAGVSARRRSGRRHSPAPDGCPSCPSMAAVSTSHVAGDRSSGRSERREASRRKSLPNPTREVHRIASCLT